MSGLFERLTGLLLLDAAWLGLALLLVPALWLRARRPGAALRFAPLALLFGADGRDRAAPSWRVRSRAVPRLLQTIGLLLLLVALARPAARDTVREEDPGLDILLCLDVSSSMTATDLDPARSRLDVAREAASAFVRGRPHDRIGLLTFARYPDLVCPLTRDHRALVELLGEVATVASDGPEDATGIGTAVARAAQVLGQAGAPAPVAVLLTDGEENVALAGVPGEIAPVEAAQLAERLGVRVYAIVAGLGRRNASGAWTAIDTRAVEALATRTGGLFQSAEDADALAGVYRRIDELVRAPQARTRTVLADRYLGFLLAGLGLLLGSRLLERTVWEVLP